MQIPTLTTQINPSSLRRELRYTLIRLQPPTWALPYRTTFGTLLKTTESAIQDRVKLTDAEEDAEAQLDQLDSELDEFALYAFKFLTAETAGAIRSSLRQALFGTEKPSRFVRPRLGEKLDRMRSWPTVLAGAPLAKLVALGKEVEALLKRVDTALSAHASAVANMQAFLSNTWSPLLTKINGERQLLGGEAKKQHRLDGKEADIGLFRGVQRPRPKTPPSLTAMTELIARTEEDLSLMRQQKTELERKAQKQASAQAERTQKAAELVALRKSISETKQKAQAIEVELTRHAK